ncbi:hypothetical protein PG995_015898 [Apiospora arundinis]
MLPLRSLLLAPLLLSSSTTTTVTAQDVIITQTITSGPTEATASASAAAEFTSSALFTSAILNSTNTYRDQHNATHLVWNRTLEDFANRYLGQVVSKRSTSSPSESPSLDSESSSNLEDRDGRKDRGGRCDFKHSGGPYGENLALGCANATSCVAAWGDERREYDFGKGDFGRRRATSRSSCGRTPRASGAGRACAAAAVAETTTGARGGGIWCASIGRGAT